MNWQTKKCFVCTIGAARYRYLAMRFVSKCLLEQACIGAQSLPVRRVLPAAEGRSTSICWIGWSEVGGKGMQSCLPFLCRNLYGGFFLGRFYVLLWQVDHACMVIVFKDFPVATPFNGHPKHAFGFFRIHAVGEQLEEVFLAQFS